MPVTPEMRDKGIQIPGGVKQGGVGWGGSLASQPSLKCIASDLEGISISYGAV